MQVRPDRRGAGRGGLSAIRVSRLGEQRLSGFAAVRVIESIAEPESLLPPEAGR